MTDDIKRMNLESKNLVVERIEQLKQLFPEIVVESNKCSDTHTHTHSF